MEAIGRSARRYWERPQGCAYPKPETSTPPKCVTPKLWNPKILNPNTRELQPNRHCEVPKLRSHIQIPGRIQKVDPLRELL